MADALAVIGPLASIVQPVEATFLAISRIQEYTSSATTIPKALVQTLVLLPALGKWVQQLKYQPLANGAEVRNLLTAFNDHLNTFEGEVRQLLRLAEDAQVTRLRKAIRSMRAAEMALEQYKITLILVLQCQAIGDATLKGLSGHQRRQIFGIWDYDPYLQTLVEEVDGGWAPRIYDNVCNSIMGLLFLRNFEEKGTAMVIVRFEKCSAISM